jgi:hypothetical protein
MDGATRDKLRWASEVVSSHRILLGRAGAPSWAPYAGCLLLRDRAGALRSRAQAFVHSGGAPAWLRGAARRYYSLVGYAHSEDAPAWLRAATQGYWKLRGRYGYGWIRYSLESARARRGSE